MPESYTHIIQKLCNRWNRNNLLAALIRVLAVSLLVAVAGFYIFHPVVWVLVLLFIITALLTWWAKPYRAIIPAAVASLLNRTYSDLEESAQLLLLPVDSLSLLQRMQVQKISGPVQQIAIPQAITQPVKKSAFLLIGAVVAGAAIAGIAYALPASKITNSNNPGNNATVVKETVLPGIASRQVIIDPPAYTGRRNRQQQQFALQVEEGSRIQWTINTTQQVKKLELLFNNRETVSLQPVDKDSTEWTLNRTITDAGFYQVNLDGMLSQLYTLEVVNDLPVRITIVTPQQYTTISPGFEPVAKLSVQFADDYGIANALIVATKASGKGESVSFKEQTLPFPVSFANQQQVTGTKMLDLPALGVKPGDELYFYVKATDNRGQESRSDMYFISLPDTAELFSMSGMESGVSQVPEYFRSQRQLIMDTEKLLREQANTNKDSFKLRSNELGEDQKILRLRYGKFLGEEYESGGHSPDDGHDHSGQSAAPVDMDAIIDQYAHKHDNAEDASYFEPEQKAQLKAILTEMWSSELKLRTFATKESLPFQYKALRLLKDMQQRSRVYVGKTSVKMPPIKPEKRLTGELDKIAAADNNKNNTKEENTDAPLQQAVAVIEQLKQHQPLLPADQLLLAAAEKAISEKAIQQPAHYLPALSAVRVIRQEPAKATRQQMVLTEAALQQIIRSREQVPQQTIRRTGSGLTENYFKNLQKTSP
jgi:hypothetical protein